MTEAAEAHNDISDSLVKCVRVCLDEQLGDAALWKLLSNRNREHTTQLLKCHTHIYSDILINEV